MKKLKVLKTDVTWFSKNEENYVSLTNIAKFKDYRTDDIIKNWLRNRYTIEFLGIWEALNNPHFNPVEFDGFRKKAGLNSFVLTAKQWIEKTKAIGLISTPGRYGGTYAHEDIALEFASWISVEFKLYLIKEFKRLKIEENQRKNLDWNLKRSLVKINYEIQTEAIREHLIPKKITKEQENAIYASEADLLNVALFGMTAKEWKIKNKQEGNLRDYANISQLVCLSNLENLNALFIKENINQHQRLIKLNEIAISQMKILLKDRTVERLEIKSDNNEKHNQ
ncbi:MAG: KilA-N domain-containing protein [Candidatus Woesearchaeota archaeon]